MILYKVPKDQEINLRKEYLHSISIHTDSYIGYRSFVLKNIPGSLDVSYLGGDDDHYIEQILFDSEQHLSWFILRYS
jgi:hypothetical protein